MIFSDPLLSGVLLRRYKRFLADVRLDDGRILTAHCPNTGAMLGCDQPGLRVWLSRSDNPKRKYAHTWELVETARGVLVGIHTGRTNALAAEALDQGLLPGLAGFRERRREVRLGDSRVDFLLRYGHGDCHLEVKNVTAAVRDGVALFPDAVSLRATRHLRELMAVVERGGRAALLFVVQRRDARAVAPFDEVDPVYGRTLREAAERGVELLACGMQVTPQGIRPWRRLPVLVVGGFGVGVT